jgi:hypothetical protein
VVFKVSGMSIMGKMMALTRLGTMAAAVLFQPVLMGPPRLPDGFAAEIALVPQATK